MAEPTVTLMARSVLFLLATVTAVTSSAVLPTRGRMMRPRKASVRRALATTCSMLLTMFSAQKETTQAEVIRRMTEACMLVLDSSGWQELV